MPLKLVPPRPGKTPAYYVRGTYLRVAVDRSTGAREERVARQILAQWKQQIERGEYRQSEEPVATATDRKKVTWLAAAVAYMKAGGDAARLNPIIEMTGPEALGHRLVDDIDQIALDTAAAVLYPGAPAPTSNREFYTPALAVLHHAGVQTRFKRPKGWRGNKSMSWLEPRQAFALFAAADQLDLEFGLFCRFLLYTGMRLSEALRVTVGRVDLKRRFLYVPKTKNNEPRAVYLPGGLVDALKAQPPRPARPRATPGQRLPNGASGRSQADAGKPFLERDGDARLFRFHAGGHLRDLLAAAQKAAGLKFPRRQGGFHLFCHTYGTWMSRYGSLDTYGLTRTGRWADPRSADRYRHTQVSEESRRAERLPAQRKRSG